MAKKKELSRSEALSAKVVYAALKILQQNEGSMPGKQVIEQVGNTVELNDWAREGFEKSGNIRWKAYLHLFSIDSVRAGFLIKKEGIWYLTPEGEDALNLGEVELHIKAREAYRLWKKTQPGEIPADEEGEEEVEIPQTIPLDEIIGVARESAVNHIRGLNAYEFQDICAALLRGMGYHTPFVAPKGKDGGIDIIAYNDPLGAKAPRIKVQVKHRADTKASAKEIRDLRGLINKEGEVGIFISTSRFTADAKTIAVNSSDHIELIDLDRFIELWKEFYPMLDDEDKGRMELMKLYFVAE